MMRFSSSFIAAVLLAVLVGEPAAAQVVRGRLVEDGTEQPIPGALVALVDPSGRELGRALTDDDGRFSLRAPRAGRYTLRADRIGYASTSSPPIELRAGETLDYRMTAPVEPVQLAGLSVEAERHCVARPEEGLRTAVVWEEARKALEVARWTEDRQLVSYAIVRYERELDLRTLAVKSERADTGWRSGGRPFVTPPAEQLADAGYVQMTAGDTFYYAPDAEILLSDAFLATHCFRVRSGAGDRQGLVGLEFEPVRGRGVADVKGVLWLDEGSAELRYLEFAYTDLRLSVPTDKFGGRMEFERLPAGTWIIRRWSIRGPVIAVRRAWWRRGGRRESLAAIKEEAGEVIAIRGRSGGG